MKKITILISLILLAFLCFSNVQTTQAKSVFILGKIIKVKQNKSGDYFSPSKIACKARTICFSIVNDTKSWIQIKQVNQQQNVNGFLCSLNPTGKILNNNTVCRVNYGSGSNALGTWLYYVNSVPKPLIVTVT